MLERVRGILFHPAEAFKEARQDTLNDACKYFLPWLVFLAVLLTALVFGALNATGISALLSEFFPLVVGGTFAGVLVGGFLLILYGSVWLHILVFLLGGRKGLTQTFKAVAYGATPIYVLGWLPGPNILIAPIWALIVVISGVMQLQEMTSGKAILVVLLALLIPLVIALAVAFAVLMPMLQPFLAPAPPS